MLAGSPRRPLHGPRLLILLSPSSPPSVPVELSGVSYARMEGMLKPYAKPFKRGDDPYLRSNALSTQQSEATAAAAAVAVQQAVAGEGEAYLSMT